MSEEKIKIKLKIPSPVEETSREEDGEENTAISPIEEISTISKQEDSFDDTTIKDEEHISNGEKKPTIQVKKTSLNPEVSSQGEMGSPISENTGKKISGEEEVLSTETPLSKETSEEKTPKTKISIQDIQSKKEVVSQTKAPVISQEELLQKQKEKEKQEALEKQNKKRIFGNYESHFQKKSENFMDKIRNIKTSPKTRMGFLLFLILGTIVSISALMFFFPEKHSIQIYKTALIQIYNTKIAKNQTVSNTGETPTSVPDITPISSTGSTENTQIPEEIKKEKLKNFLLESYGK